MPRQYNIPVRTGQAVTKRAQTPGKLKEGPLGEVTWSTLFKGTQSSASQATNLQSIDFPYNDLQAPNIHYSRFQDVKPQLLDLDQTPHPGTDAQKALPVHSNSQKLIDQYSQPHHSNLQHRSLQPTMAQVINVQPVNPKHLTAQPTTSPSTKSHATVITTPSQYSQLARAQHHLLRCHRRFFNQIQGPDRASIPPLAQPGFTNELKQILNSTSTMLTEQKLEVRRWAFQQQIAETMRQVNDAKEREGIFWAQLYAVLLFGERDGGEAMWCKEGHAQLQSAIQQQAGLHRIC